MTWEAVIETVQKFWLQFFLTGLSGAIVMLWKKINESRKEQKKAREEQEKEDEVMKGAVRALLRDRLFVSANYYLRKGEITTSELEVFEGLLKSYEILNGNGIAHAIASKVEKCCKIIIEENG